MMDHAEAALEGAPTYHTPAVVFEVDLELHAGSPLALPDPLGAFGDGELPTQ